MLSQNPQAYHFVYFWGDSLQSWLVWTEKWRACNCNLPRWPSTRVWSSRRSSCAYSWSHPGPQRHPVPGIADVPHATRRASRRCINEKRDIIRGEYTSIKFGFQPRELQLKETANEEKCLPQCR